MPDFETSMNIICLESKAFKALISEVTKQIKEEQHIAESPWINEQEAMRLLRISSKTTFKKYKDEGDIIVSTPSNKHLLYHRDSILEFIEKKVKK
jgi:hypothetical protein